MSTFDALFDEILKKPLSDHERKVLKLLFTLEGSVQGFPDTKLKLRNLAVAYAKFMDLEPYHVKFDPQIEQDMTEEDKAPYMWKDGLVPGEWLIGQIRDSCEWMPAPVVAREMYCEAGFPPLDGLTMDKISALGRRARRAELEA